MCQYKKTKLFLASLCSFIVVVSFVYHNKISLKINLEYLENKVGETQVVTTNNNMEFITQEKNSATDPPSKKLFMKKYQKTLCDLDKHRIDKLIKYNVSMNQGFNGRKVRNYVNNFFHTFIQKPHRSFCNELKRFGGRYYKWCKFSDGSKVMCMDDLIKDMENKECLIYSFGIAKDWSFEDLMDEFGCRIYAFDGSVDYPEKRGRNIRFEKSFIGFKDNETENVKSLTTILKEHGHSKTKVSYIKMDIEGDELTSLPVWLREGALKNVKQIGMEFHLRILPDENKQFRAIKTYNFTKTLQSLYVKGNYRLISYDVNACAHNSKVMGGEYYYLAEIVIKKINNDDKCQ